jgi:hypothetical protein
MLRLARAEILASLVGVEQRIKTFVAQVYGAGVGKHVCCSAVRLASRI